MKQPPIELFRQALGSDRAPKHFFSSGRQTSVIRDFGSHLDARLGPSQAPPDRLEESRHKLSLVSVGPRCIEMWHADVLILFKKINMLDDLRCDWRA